MRDVCHRPITSVSICRALACNHDFDHPYLADLGSAAGDGYVPDLSGETTHNRGHHAVHSTTIARPSLPRRISGQQQTQDEVSHITMLTTIYSTLTSTPLPITLSALLLLTSLIYLLATEFYRHKRRLSTLPGPPGLPIVGNLTHLHPDPAETLRQWSAEYGPVYQIMLGIQPVVIFNTMQSARDVFIGQGHSLIDKPRFYTFHSVLSTVASSIGTTVWNDSTKRRRKTAAGAMNRPGVATYLPFLDELSRSLIAELLELGGGDGEKAFNPRLSLDRAIVDLTVAINYGVRLPANEPGLLHEIIEVEDRLSRVKTPLGSPQDFVPALRLLPFNRQTKEAAETNRRRLVYLRRFEREMAERVKKGTDRPCIQSNVLRDPTVELNDVDLMSISMSMVSGGLDTMVNTLAWTIGMLALRPAVQEAAYSATIDAYGTGSWGPIEDETGVPYITALVKECLRYFTVFRLSLPRAAYKDIQYQGMHVPKGTMVFLNSWSCNRDKATYGEDAEEFRPERFLEDPELPHASYGFGTRMCAGVHLANRQLYVIILRLIWAFEVGMSEDPEEKIEHLRPLEVSEGA